MTTKHTLFRLAALTLALTPALSAVAQDKNASSQIQQEWQISAGALAQALNQVASQSGIILTFSPELVAGKASAGLQGRYSNIEALQALLQGTDLQAQFVDSETVTLIKAPKSAGPITLQTISVKGELLERDVQDSLTSAVVVAGEDLERRGDPDLYDLIERTPGVGILGGESGFSIRGISQRGPGGGTGRTISITVDGETVSNSNRATFLGSYSTWDLEQVEILRGPQSTQTGRNALAGAIVIRSKDPVYDTEGKFRLELGENDTKGVAFAYNTQVVEDRFAIRIAGQSLKNDGEIENVTIGGNANERTDQTFRIGLRVDFTDNFSAILKHTISDVEAGDDLLDVAQFEIEDRKNTANFQTERTNKKDSTNLRLSYQLAPNKQIEWETTYYETDWKFLSDIDNSPTPGGTRLDSATVESIQHEARLHFEDEGYNGVLGAYYTDVDENSFGAFSVPNSFLDELLASLGFPGFPIGLPSGSVDTISTGTGRTENYALFGELEYQVTPQFDVTIGARYDREENGAVDGRGESIYNPATLEPLLSFIGGPSGVTTSPDTTTSFEAFLPKLALGYDLNDDLRVGFTIQRAYRAGGSSTALGIGPYEFDEEYAWNYELSLRTQWYDGRLTVNANAFHMDWTDQQITQQALPLNFIIVNAGKSRLYGMEVDITARPTDDLELFASLAYVDTKFTDYVVETAGAVTDFTGNEFAGAPPITASVGVTKYFFNSWYVSADASYTDEFFTGTGNEETAGNYALYNARFGYEDDAWEVFGYARNLFDKLYQTAGGNLTTPGARVNEGRVIGIVGQYNF